LKNSNSAFKGSGRVVNKSIAAPRALRLIGLPFFLIGTIIALVGLNMFYTWYKSENWPKAQAKVVSAEIATHRGSKGGSTYSLKGSFTYDYEGRSYTGQQFEIESGSSSAYDEKRAMLDTLQAAIAEDKPLEAFVNPEDPSEAFIFRHVSMGMMLFVGIGGLFSIIGLVILTGVFPLGNVASIDDTMLKKQPKEPWLADSRWQGFNLKTNHWKKLCSQWGIAIGMSVFISFFVYLVFTDKSAPFFAKAIIGLFSVISVGLLVQSVYMTLQYFKFRESALLLSQMPLCGGCEFMAVLAVEERFTIGQEFCFELVCERRLVTGSGKNSHTTTDVLHKSSYQASAGSECFRNRRIYIPVRMQIPADFMPNTDVTANPSITWKLLASASVPGVDFAAEFSLPVYEAEPELVKYRS
jgi:hypothetical protein